MLKVIIADDERLICRLIQELVDWKALEMEVAGTAENGLEALELINTCHPDILVTDIRMPGCDGLELIKKAKQTAPSLEIVIISGYAHFEYAQQAIRYGVGSYLLKPIKQEELILTLRKIKERICEQAEVDEVIRKSESRKIQKRDLINDMLTIENLALTREKLENIYGFSGDGKSYQMFVLKVDCDIREVHQAEAASIREKAEEILQICLKGYCSEMLFCMENGFGGYGLLNYRPENKNIIRKKLRDAVNLLDAQRSLYGQVEFSIGLGTEFSNPQDYRKSLQSAEYAVQERLLEGTGRLFEKIPKGSGSDRQAILKRYAANAKSAIDNLDKEEAEAAADTLEKELLALPGICGREFLESVIAAGNVFIVTVKMGAGNVEEIQQDFKCRCGQCGGMRQLIEDLKHLSGALLDEARELKRSEENRPVRIAKQYMMQHYHEPITLEEICDITGFSVSYFSSLFKKETGESYLQYLSRIRIEEAKNLLRDTSLPVWEICERVGYSDRKHFTKTFRKVVGLNPAEYRKLYG